MSKVVILKANINISDWEEQAHAEHPLDGMTFGQIKKHLEELEQEYAGYVGIRYVYEWKYSRGYYQAWYNLVGIASPLTEALK